MYLSDCVILTRTDCLTNKNTGQNEVREIVEGSSSNLNSKDDILECS